MIGKSIQHYQILEKIGAGGMGVVYRATDTRLKRQVVLKFLPDDASGSDARLERFRREAQAASALNHPNICTIHDIGEHEGRPYIVMELLEGEPLKNTLTKSGLSLDQILDFGIQLCSALEAAHSRGIVHRDIKPDNIFVVHGNQVKVLDFGLAKLASSSMDEQDLVGPEDVTLTQDPSLTRAGTTLGTRAYMSPEQSLGHEVDHRSDIFSLGVVLYEMCTGQRAFTGKTATEISNAILNKNPVLECPEGVLSPGLRPILEKAMEKECPLRYQSTTELLTDLKRLQRDQSSTDSSLTITPPSDTRRVVAVLPFILHSGNQEDEFLSLALAEAVSHELSGKPELLLRPTSAVVHYDPKQVSPQRVAQDLGADVVVDGSIQTMASTLRVQVQAWEAASQSTLLSVKLDGSMNDLFGLQDRVAEALSSGLGVADDSSPHEPPTKNPRAYELYLRARERLLAYSEVDTQRGIALLRSALELDTGFADGWALLAIALVNLGSLFDPQSKWYVEAEQATSRALDLEPDNAEAWIARGRILWSPHHNFKISESLHLLHGVCCRPSHPPDAPLWYSTVLAHIGLHEKAIDLSNELLKGDPNNLAKLVKAECYGWNGDAGSFYELLDESIHGDVGFEFGYLFLPIPLLYLDRFQEAELAIEKARSRFKDDSLFVVTEALLWAKRGERDKALQFLDLAERNQKSVSHLHHMHQYAASVCAVLGEDQAAIKHLAKAATTGMPNYTAFTRDPHFGALQKLKEYRELMNGLRPMWEEYTTTYG